MGEALYNPVMEIPTDKWLKQVERAIQNYRAPGSGRKNAGVNIHTKVAGTSPNLRKFLTDVSALFNALLLLGFGASDDVLFDLRTMPAALAKRFSSALAVDRHIRSIHVGSRGPLSDRSHLESLTKTVKECPLGGDAIAAKIAAMNTGLAEALPGFPRFDGIVFIRADRVSKIAEIVYAAARKRALEHEEPALAPAPEPEPVPVLETPPGPASAHAESVDTEPKVAKKRTAPGAVAGARPVKKVTRPPAAASKE